MKKLLMVEDMISDAMATRVVNALKTIDGVNKVTPSVKDRAVLIDCSPYVTESDLFSTAVAAGFNVEVKVDYSLQTAIAEAEKRMDGYAPKI